MVYHGRVKNGVIELDGDPRLPDGAEVRVDVVHNGESPPGDEPLSTLYECLKSIIGAVDDLPEDASRNVDHYLYGQPKR